MRKTSSRHIRQKKESGELYTRQDFICSEYSAFGVSILMNCSCLIAISSYINALFFCKKTQFVWNGSRQIATQIFAQIRIPIVLGEAMLRNESPLYCGKQFSTSILSKCSLQRFDWFVYLRVSSNS
jgi:hypothetical protein